MHLQSIRKKIIIMVSILTVIFFSPMNLSAENPSTLNTPNLSQNYLQLITEITYRILQNVNNFPVYLNSLAQFIESWMQPDTSTTTANLQGNFTQVANLFIQNTALQNSWQQQLNFDLLRSSVTNRNQGGLVYSSILGLPIASTQLQPPNKTAAANIMSPQYAAQYTYIKNASGINLRHMAPGFQPAWSGTLSNQELYKSFYDTVMPIESFNGYVLSKQVSNGNQFNTLETALIQQMGNPTTWFAQIASENIGTVLRQLLLIQSQTFILLTQLVQTEQQLLTAQAMTNTLLILNNQPNEAQMLNNAQNAITKETATKSG